MLFSTCFSLLIVSDKLAIIGVFSIVFTDTLVLSLFESAIDKLIATKESPPKSKKRIFYTYICTI